MTVQQITDALEILPKELRNIPVVLKTPEGLLVDVTFCAVYKENTPMHILVLKEGDDALS